jgi:nucleoside-diphosphate-sugar epimerase
MVVGNGLLGKAFKQYENDNKVLIFASGVSNSMETDIKAYNRELELLTSFSNTSKKLVYFSTISVYDPDLQCSAYVKHKLRMEDYIATEFTNYVIFRLPNVIGITSNNNTFFNNIKNKLLDAQDIFIKQQATRYLIDINDLVATIPNIIPQENKTTINACFDNKTSVRDLVKIMATILQVKYREILIPAGSDYSVNNSKFLSYIPDDSVGLSQNYNYIILNKYLNDNILSTK